MSNDDFTFFTPAQLIEARHQSIVTNKERIVCEYTELFERITHEVQLEINAKLMAATTSTWEQSDATQCSLKFCANELVSNKLTETERVMIVSYYSFNSHKNLDERLYDNVVLTLSDKLIKLTYFQCDLFIPIILKLAEIGYAIELGLDQNDWGVIVNWKLI